MAATPPPPEHPSEREQDLMREIERATSWPEEQWARTDLEKQNPEEAPCPPSDV
jgi:hypothetical protein